MLGSAFGDSLGAAVEFDSASKIQERFGLAGILWPAGFSIHPPYSITDDTQQTLAVAEGCLDACLYDLTDAALRSCIWKRLKTWRRMQSEPGMRREPGNTSLTALQNETLGSLESRLNKSNSCGAVMRTHPLGLLFRYNRIHAFTIGMHIATLTHGGDEAIGAAGATAAIVAGICSGLTIERSIQWCLEPLESSRAFQTKDLLEKAGDATLRIADLGQGWEAHEALAIAAHCALRHPTDFLAAVRLAANHDGDSDSTAAITGAFVGAAVGVENIPRDCSGRLELRGDLRRTALSLATIAQQHT